MITPIVCSTFAFIRNDYTNSVLYFCIYMFLP